MNAISSNTPRLPAAGATNLDTAVLQPPHSDQPDQIVGAVAPSPMRRRRRYPTAQLIEAAAQTYAPPQPLFGYGAQAFMPPPVPPADVQGAMHRTDLQEMDPLWLTRPVLSTADHFRTRPCLDSASRSLRPNEVDRQQELASMRRYR